MQFNEHCVYDLYSAVLTFVKGTALQYQVRRVCPRTALFLSDDIFNLSVGPGQ